MKLFSLLTCTFFLLLACQSDDSPAEKVEEPTITEPTPEDPTVETPEPTLNLADIDFTNWKITLPIDEDNNGRPDEYKPADLVDGNYREVTSLQSFMFDDTTDQSIVFYTYPYSSTPNSKYSRTELRELIEPSNSRINWSLEEGGQMKGKLKVESISEDKTSSRTYHQIIVMQIHGIISIEDMETFGFSSNNGPPLIKIYWKDGDIWCHKKSLVNESTSGDSLLNVDSDTWADEKVNMGTVGFEAFEFEIKASTGKLSVQLNDNEPIVYEDVSLAKWPFENYFKAGNYLTSIDSEAASTIKYYSLEVTH